MQKEIIQLLFFAVACFTIIMNRGLVSPVILSTIFFDSMNLHWMSQSIWEYDYLMRNLDRAKWAITMQKICP